MGNNTVSKTTLLSENNRNGYLSIQEQEQNPSNIEARPPITVITPIPWKQVIILMLVRLSDPIGSTLILPFVYQFVKRSGIAKSTGEIGWYVGILAASFSLGQSLTAIFWGQLSDRIGRRPAILYGLAGSLVATLCFGLTNNFYMALVIRSAGGLLNGNVSIIKSSLAEITDKTNRAQIFAFLPFTRNIGGIIGPLIGGLLYDPSKKIPWLFGSIPAFEKYPHLLPCLISVVLYSFGLILGITNLKETHNTELKKPKPKNNIRSKKSKKTNLKTKTQCIDKNKPTENKMSLQPKKDKDILQTSSSTLSYETEPGCSNTSSRVINKSENEVLLNADDDSSISSYSSVREERSFRDKFSSTMLTVLVTNSTMNLASSMFQNFFPVWSASDIDFGGLGFTPEDISLALSFSGMAVFYVQLVIYPYINRKYGTLATYRMGLLVSFPTSFILPIVSILAKLSNETGGIKNVIERAISLSTRSVDIYYILLWIVLELVLCVRIFGNVFSLTSVNLMITNATTSASDLGLMNGIQQVIGSLFRVIGPVLAGALWNLTLNNRLMYPFDNSFVWNLIGSLYLYTWIKSGKIPKIVNDAIIDK
ncbi:hypothetical protein BB558_005296, partial [Smittium angustum]